MTRNGAPVEAFRDVDTSGLPDLGALDERRQMFWILLVGQEHLEVAAMTPAEISTVLRDAHGISVSRQRIEATLSSETGTVAKRKVAGRRAYQLMAKGSASLDAATDAALFIDPERGFTGLRAAHSLLATLEGELRVCDPYIDARTLDMLAACEAADSIRLLTQKVNSPEGFKQSLKAFGREHPVALEIQIAKGGVLHDRYAIHDGGMLMFGTSLNGLGLKQSFVVALGEDLRAAALAAFESTWDAAKPL